MKTSNTLEIEPEIISLNTLTSISLQNMRTENCLEGHQLFENIDQEKIVDIATNVGRGVVK